MTHVIRKQRRGKNHPKNIISRPLRNLLSQMPVTQSQVTQVYRCLKGKIVNRLKRRAHYGVNKPLPYNNLRRNHIMLRRLQSRKFVDGTGMLSPTLRQLLANQGLHQMPRLVSRINDIEQRVQQASTHWQGTEQERLKFKDDFTQWIKTGAEETRENVFWRIKYYEYIQLGLEFHYWKPIERQHKLRHARGLKSALHRD